MDIDRLKQLTAEKKKLEAELDKEVAQLDDQLDESENFVIDESLKKN